MRTIEISEKLKALGTEEVTPLPTANDTDKKDNIEMAPNNEVVNALSNEEMVIDAETPPFEVGEVEDEIPLPTDFTFGGLPSTPTPSVESTASKVIDISSCSRHAEDNAVNKTVTVVPVPLRKQDYYKEEDIINLSMGRTGYFDILAKRYSEKPSRLSTGIPDLDYVTGGGWVNNGLSVVAAAPNVGKTTILIQSACAMAQQGTTVVYITNDMRKSDLEAKIISGMSYFLSGEECLTLSDITNKGALSMDTPHNKAIATKLENTMKYLHIRDLIADEDFDKKCESDLTLDGMGKLEKIFNIYTSVYKNVVFIVDSLQQVAGYIDTGKNGVDTMLRVFKEMSATAPVIMISTLNRTGYAKQQGEINFSDLKETGALEYNADLLITIVPKCFVDTDPKEDLKGFKMSKYRDVMISCKKSRDSEEREKALTLYAPGCTFIPYKGEDTHVDTSRGFTSKPRRGKSNNPVLPPAGAMNWGSIG